MNQAHSWNVTAGQAVAVQQQLREQVRLEPFDGTIRLIGGADISFNKYEPDIYAGIVLLDYDTQEVVLRATVKTRASFPYVPGLLSFREIPALLQAWELLPVQPEVMVMDGQGIAHMRRLGVASHFGLLTDQPTIGCAKSVLVGAFTEPKPEKGSFAPMVYKDEVVAYALRTKNKVKPVYISPGHRMDLESSRRIMLHCARGYRIPEPTRQAHLTVNAVRRGEIEPGVAWLREDT
jgi:deoxyribonuclease V